MDASSFARRLGIHDPKLLRIGAFLAWILVASCFFVFFKLHHTRRASIGGTPGTGGQVFCNETVVSDYCEMVGDIRVDGSTATVYVAGTTSENAVWTIKPYARKFDPKAMGSVRKWEVKLVSKEAPSCTRKHSSPGILFSAGGYADNLFHNFADTLLPLFAEAKPFKGKVEFLITDSEKQPLFVGKFQPFLRILSKYSPLDVDYQEGSSIHCYPSLTVGHKHRSEKELSLEDAGTEHTIKDFMELGRSLFKLRKARTTGPFENMRIPRILIIERKHSRVITNTNSIYEIARRLGVKVLAHELESDVEDISQAVNVCDIVLGVYGSGLSSSIFLPDNAVVIQIVPFGVPEKMTERFRSPAMEMGMRYLEYAADLEESSVGRQYAADHAAVRNPKEIADQGEDAVRSTYLSQNITINISRFNETLIQALEILGL